MALLPVNSSNHTYKRTLTVVAISALLRRLQIGSEPVRDERYPTCGSADPNNRSSSSDTRDTLSSLVFPLLIFILIGSQINVRRGGPRPDARRMSHDCQVFVASAMCIPSCTRTSSAVRQGMLVE